MHAFVLGGIEVPAESGNRQVKQVYKERLRKTIHEMGDGSRYQQSYALSKKLDTTITGDGAWSPPALAGLDYSQPQELLCAAPRSVCSSETNEVALPIARRTDTGYEPKGFYTNGKGHQVETGINVLVDVATLTESDDAINYIVQYYPKITVDATLNQEVMGADGKYSWVIECKEL